MLSDKWIITNLNTPLSQVSSSVLLGTQIAFGSLVGSVGTQGESEIDWI